MSHKNERWTPELTDRLRKLWATGKTCAVIAAELGGGFTRNAVIGKATRLKLEARRPGNPEGNNQSRNAAQVRRNARKRDQRRENGSPEWSALRRAAFIATPLPTQEPVSLGVSLLNLTPSGCRWAYGDGPFLFCGHMKQFGSSYCPYHRRVSINRRPDEPKAVRLGWGSTGTHLGMYV